MSLEYLCAHEMMPTHVVSFDSLSEVLASCFHDRDWYFEVISHTDKNSYCFCQYANYLSFPSHWNILTFVRYALFRFIQFLWKHNSFMWIFVFRRKKLERNFAFSTTAICVYFASLTLYADYPSLVNFAGDKNVAFGFSDACLFGHPVYFEIF